MNKNHQTGVSPAPLVHGGDWAGYSEEYGTQPLDFSANVSPLGVPQGVKQAIANAAETADRYPDPCAVPCAVSWQPMSMYRNPMCCAATARQI